MLFQQNIQDVIAQDMEMWPLAKGELSNNGSISTSLMTVVVRIY